MSGTTTDTHEIAAPYSGTKVRSVTTTVAATGGIDATSGLVKDVTTTTTEVATGVNPSSSKSERTYHSVVFNDPTNWCIGRPQTSQQINSHTLTFGAALTRTVQTTWDGSSCRPTQVQVEPGSPTLQVTVAFGYDTFGNVSSQSVTGVGMTARNTSVSWGANGRFPLSVTNALNETTQQGWDAALGLQTSVTDPNGLATSWTYDAFGRRQSEARADNTSTALNYSACNGSCDARIKLQFVEQQKDTSGQVVRTNTIYFDRWDRLIWQKSQLLTANDTTWSLRREYDARGSLSKDYVPYLTSGADNGYRQVSYDALGRPTAESLYRAGGVLDRTTSVAYAGLAVTQTDPLNHTTTRTLSAWGPLVRVTDPMNGQMNYQYVELHAECARRGCFPDGCEEPDDHVHLRSTGAAVRAD